MLYLHFTILILAFLYSLPVFAVEGTFFSSLYYASRIAASLFTGGLVSIILNKKLINRFFNQYETPHLFTKIKNTSPMYDENTSTTVNPRPAANPSNKILIKGIITASLILIMLIPTAFIQSLITEREDRQHDVVEEVSSKWAKQQTLSAPYLVIPYTEGKTGTLKQNLLILPAELNVKGSITEEDRKRSIYKVLLYKTGLNFSGSFHAANINDSAVLLLNEAKLCFGLSDFRGIEDKLNITFNNQSYTLLPGLPNITIDSTGLSVPVNINAADFNRGINFNLDIALRGSGSLHFLPVASYSNYNIQSPWPNPSFDGNTLPSQRTVSTQGFLASWKFNAANLSFTNIIKDSDHPDIKSTAFGVSLVQPADQYAKSMRSAKYAILIIGLTFVLFFVFELLQKKPVHPVQYALIGMALVIFYILLLSVSEIILFEYAYIIAAVATIILIALYAKSHFSNLRSAIIIGLLLTGLYGLIYVLISLEDTALLVGSIALFIVVAIIMYVTRKINWYQPETHATINFQS